MPLVINEFEVVAEPAQQPAQAIPAAANPAAPERPDLELLLLEYRARDERVRAY
jgi:hypothetical protein